MEKTLGLDVGSHSIGWSIRNLSLSKNQIVDYGVLTFKKGVAENQGIESPLVQKRTQARGTRRNYQAEKYRKWGLLEILILNGMCPLSMENLDKWRKYDQNKSRVYPQTKEFLNWLRFDFNGDGKPDFELLGLPKTESHYAFRAMAVNPDFKDIYSQNPHILGRIFYHLVQRRGFRGRDEQEAKTMLEGSEESNTAGRNAIESYISKYKTLGAALYYYQKDTGERIRKRYNLRSDYKHELKEICRLHNVSNDLSNQLEKYIIWQRNLRTQSGLIGKCTYEPNKKRCAVSHPLYEEYRTWIFINNMKIVPPEGIQYADYIHSKIYPLFFKSGNDFKISSILKQVKKDGGQVNSNFKPDSKAPSANLLNSFSQIFGENWKEKLYWNEMFLRNSISVKRTEKKYDVSDIWHVLKNFNDPEKIIEFAEINLKLSKDKVDKFSKIKIKDGYAPLSLSAIKKILPFLKKGFLYNHAVYLSNMHKVIGCESLNNETIELLSEKLTGILESTEVNSISNKVVNSLISKFINDSHRYSIEDGRLLDDSEKRILLQEIKQVVGLVSWNNITEKIKSNIINASENKFHQFLCKPVTELKDVYFKNERIHDNLFDLIKKIYSFPDKNKKHLWHPSEQQLYAFSKEYYEYQNKGKSYFILDDKRSGFEKQNPEASFCNRTIKLLGSPEPISKGFKNPMALKTMHKLRLLINHLLKEEKIDEHTRIIVEMAREMNTMNMRAAINRYQREQEKINESIKKKIMSDYPEIDKISSDIVNRYKLWEEQNFQCLYTGKTISIIDVLNGNKYDFEHTIPRVLSFDNELKNLTLCDSNYNRNTKKNKIPFELANYDEIKPRLSVFEKKIAIYEKRFQSSRNSSRYATDIDRKNKSIQDMHYNKMHLDYWRAKLRGFTCEEYKPEWKNSQLKDTQIATKYALPYLKTIFKKVEVKKAFIVNDFKEIYSVKFTAEKKSRDKHHHHAVDAAILTLIPSSNKMIDILKKFYIAKNNNNKYHIKPDGWKSFNPKFILDIEQNVLINRIPENKYFTHTRKNVRKNGKICYGENELPIKADGNCVRGQIHDESFYGIIKNQTDDSHSIVIKKPLEYKRKGSKSSGFENLTKLEEVIVDKSLFKMICRQVEAKGSFEDALNEGVYFLDKKGNRVNKIRSVRCYAKLISKNSAVKLKKHSHLSNQKHKQYYYVRNAMMPVALLYECRTGGNTIRDMRVLSLYEISQMKIKSTKQFKEESKFRTLLDKNNNSFDLRDVLEQGIRVLFFKDSLNELKCLSKKDLLKRLYLVNSFEKDNRINFKHHLVAKSMDKEKSSVDFENPHATLRLSRKNWDFAVENKHFTVSVNGDVTFI